MEATQDQTEQAAALVARLQASFGISADGETEEKEQVKYVIYAAKVNASDAVLVFEDFHELFQNLASYIQKVDSMKDLDYLMRKIFMNVTVKDGKVTNTTQNSPFRELCLDAESAMVTLPGFEPGFAP